MALSEKTPTVSWLENCVVVVCLIIVLLTHDLDYIMNQSFWLDEAWVAVSAVFQVSDLMMVSSSTPPAWNLIQQVLSPWDAQRLFPLAFIVVAGFVAYKLGKAATVRAYPDLKSRYQGVLVGAATGLAVLLAPTLLVRNDLKQYTADAFASVLLWLLVFYASQRPFRVQRLWILAVASAVLFTFSTASVFATCGALMIVLFDMIAHRRWQDLRASVPVLLTWVGALAAEYLLLYNAARSEVLVDYWKDYYPTVGEVPSYVVDHLAALTDLSALGPWYLPIALCFALAVLGMVYRKSLVWAFPAVLWLGTIAAGVLRLYPLLDARTSTFLLAITTLGAVLGIALGVVRLAGIVENLVPKAAARPVQAALLAVLLLVLSGTQAVSAYPQFGSHAIPDDDMKSLTRFLMENYQDDDVVLVNRLAAFGLAYYLRDFSLIPKAEPIPDTSLAVGFAPTWPGDQIVCPPYGSEAEWLSVARRQAAEKGGDLWIIVSRDPGARLAWTSASPNAENYEFPGALLIKVRVGA
jgi:hypothetical protein